MGTKAFTNFLISIQGRIGSLNHVIVALEKQVTMLTASLEGIGPNVEQAAHRLVETRRQLGETRAAIEDLKKFFVKMKKQWMKPKDRVIGYVVWAPPISFSSPSTTFHDYTKDVCVIKLNKEKFLPNFRGNVLDLGVC
jgi:septal ring factor EnvC (AmiA/AmiB activator)